MDYKFLYHILFNAATQPLMQSGQSMKLIIAVPDDC